MAEQDAVMALQTIIGLSEGGAKSAVEQLRQRGFTLTPLQPVQQEPVGKWEFIARLVCSSFGNNPDKHWQSYNTPAMRMAVNAYRDYLAAQGLRVVTGEATPAMCAAFYNLCKREHSLAVKASDVWRVMSDAATTEPGSK